MSFGQTLKAAREAKGITASELAASTHLLVQIVEGLENEDFRRIPAPIYGRGFVKLYCETVGLDPKPLQAEFMSLYNQAKDAPEKKPTPPKPKPEVPPPPPPAPEPEPVREPESTPEPEPVQEPEPAPGPESAHAEQPLELDLEPAVPAPPAPEQPEPEPTVQQLPPRQAPAPVAPQPPPQPEPEPVAPPAPTPTEPMASQPRRSYGDLFEQSYTTDVPEKPSAAERFRDTMSNVSSGVFSNVKRLPRNTGRIVTVAVGAILLIVLIAWGVSELYKATTPASDDVKAPAVAEKPKQSTTSKTASAEKPKERPAEKQAASEKPKAKPAEKQAVSEKPKEKPTQKPAEKADPKGKAIKPGDLKSSGMETPSLYID